MNVNAGVAIGGAARSTAAVLLLLLATTATAPASSPTCAAEMAAVDRDVVRAMVRVLEAGDGPGHEQCAAIANQIRAITAARDVHLRCYPPGARLDGLVSVLDTSAVELRQAQASLGCSTTGTAL
jgi:hypothetical protein